MGTTAADWNVTGNLAVTGTQTFTGAQVVTGALSTWGALYASGAATLASTLTVTGAATLTGGATLNARTRVLSEFAVGAAATIADTTAGAATQSYTWMYADGIREPRQVRLCLYDGGAGAWRIGYLHNGSLVWKSY